MEDSFVPEASDAAPAVSPYTPINNDFIDSQAVKSLLHGGRTLLFFSYRDWQRVSRNGRLANSTIPITWPRYPYFDSYDGFKSARDGLIDAGIIECVDRGDSLYRYVESWRDRPLSEAARVRIQKPLEAIKKRADRARDSRTKQRPSLSPSPSAGGPRGEVQPHHAEDMQCGSTSPQGEVHPHHAEDVQCGSTSPQGEVHPHSVVRLNLVRGEAEPHPLSIPIQTTTATKTVPRPIAALTARLPVNGGGGNSPSAEREGLREWVDALPKFGSAEALRRWGDDHNTTMTDQQAEVLARMFDEMAAAEKRGTSGGVAKTKAKPPLILFSEALAEVQRATQDENARKACMAPIIARTMGQDDTRGKERVLKVIGTHGVEATIRAAARLVETVPDIEKRFMWLMERGAGARMDLEAKR